AGSGRPLNLGSAKICSSSASSGSSCTSPARVKGNAGIIIGPNAANVTIMGGGTAGGVQQFEYCLKDLGGNAFLHITDLRCLRAKTAGLLLLSDNVLVENSLVGNTIPDALIEVPAGAGGGGGQGARGHPPA